MSDEIDWIVVKDRRGDVAIGAVAFLGDEAIAVVSYYEENDANKDGTVSMGEKVAGFFSPVSMKGVGVYEVVSRARDQMTLKLADANAPHNTEARAKSLKAMQGGQIQKLGAQMAMDGIFKAYIGTGINVGVGKAAKVLDWSMVKELAIKKGSEKLAKTAFDAATY